MRAGWQYMLQVDPLKKPVLRKGSFTSSTAFTGKPVKTNGIAVPVTESLPPFKSEASPITGKAFQRNCVVSG
jgi:hypothetical protein